MATVVAILGMRPFPTSGTGAIRGSQMTAERASEKIKGLVVVTSDCSAFLGSQRKAQTVEDSDRPAAVATTVTPSGLAQIVEQSDNGNAVGRVTTGVGKHMFVYLK